MSWDENGRGDLLILKEFYFIFLWILDKFKMYFWC